MARPALKLAVALASLALFSGNAAAQYDLTKDLPGSDQPPVGRSLADYLLVSGDGTQMNVPFPIENLIASLSSRLGVQPRVTMIPQGRSLQRDHSDYASPRTIFAFTDNGPPASGQLGPMAKDRLYLGYAEKANQIEVISYNAAAGRYEFQLVKDYRQGGQLQLVYADRVLCTKCHHNGAPIFAPVPWTESTAWDHNLTVNGSITANLTVRGVGAPTLHGFKVAVDKDIPYKITESAARANTIMPLQKLWQFGCGADQADAPRCRGYVLQLVFEKALKHQIAVSSASPAYTGAWTAWKKYWPQYLSGGLVIPTYFLLDPLVAPDSAASQTQTTFADLKNPDGLTPAAADRLRAMLAKSQIPAAIDPLVQLLPPLETWYLDHSACYGNCLVYGIYDLMTDADRKLVASIATGDVSKVSAAIDALVAANDPSLGNHAFRRGQVLAALAKQLGAPPLAGAFYDDEQPHMPQLVLDSTVVPVGGDTPLAKIETYCVPCHRQLPGKKGFLSGATDAAKLAAIKVEAVNIYNRLNWESPPDDGSDLMPPDGDPKRTALDAHPADRQAIMNWVKSL